MKKQIAIIPILLVWGICLIQSSCMEKKYKYGVKVTSADGYKCMISWSGCFLGEAAIPFSASGSWGVGMAAMACGPDMKSLPDTMQVIYFSLTENQFYRLSTPIDKEKIRPLLEARYPRKGRDDAYYYNFTVGIAPKGFVSLWLSGSAGKLLIDTYHAEKIDYNYRVAFPTDGWNREEVVREYSKALCPFIQKEIAKGEISSEYWESLNTPYKWKLRFNDDRFSLYDYDIYLINQENRMYLTDPAWPVTDGNKFIPAEMTLYLKHTMDPVKYKVIIMLRDPYIEYDDEEVTLTHMNKSRVLLDTFETFYRHVGNDDVSIYVDFDFSMKSLKLKLRSSKYEAEFPDYTYRIYDSEHYDYR